MSRPEEPARANAGGHGRRPASTLRSVNLAVRLFCELALLATLALWGVQVGSGAAAKLTLDGNRRGNAAEGANQPLSWPITGAPSANTAAPEALPASTRRS